MKKVYIIGQYSDYRSVAVCSTSQKAEAFLAGLGDAAQDYAIEDYEVDKLPDVHPVRCLSMLANGDVEPGFDFASTRDGPPQPVQFIAYWPPQCLQLVISTGEKQTAIKVANEIRVQVLAANAWNDAAATSQLFGKRSG